MNPPTAAPLDTAAAAALLAGGGVLVLPTDTVCGLHARADSAPALARLAALKGRAPDKPLLVLAASLAQALELCLPLSDAQRAQCAAAWPGPFTFILPARPELPAAVRDTERGTVAVRVPGRADLRELIDRAGGPLASTSANRAGEAPLLDLEAAAGAFAAAADGWWRGREGPGTGEGRPSALVDLCVPPGAPPRVLREGPRPLPPPATGVA